MQSLSSVFSIPVLYSSLFLIIYLFFLHSEPSVAIVSYLLFFMSRIVAMLLNLFLMCPVSSFHFPFVHQILLLTLSMVLSFTFMSQSSALTQFSKFKSKTTHHWKVVAPKVNSCVYFCNVKLHSWISYLQLNRRFRFTFLFLGFSLSLCILIVLGTRCCLVFARSLCTTLPIFLRVHFQFLVRNCQQFHYISLSIFSAFSSIMTIITYCDLHWAVALSTVHYNFSVTSLLYAAGAYTNMMVC